MTTLEDQVAVVTGASSGIGRAVALELASQRCHLAIGCHSKTEQLEETAVAAKRFGGQVTTHQIDIANPTAVDGFCRQVLADHGSVQILVNNAGVGLVAPIESMSHEDLDWLMQINFSGLVHTTKAFLPTLKRYDSHVVNVANVWGLWACPAQAAYTASKFAVVGFTEALAQELSKTSVSVSLIIPGGVRTEIARNARFCDGTGPFKDRQAAIRLFDRVALTSATKAAKLIVSAIQEDRPRVLVGLDAHLIDLVHRLLPSASQRLLPLVFRH